ncbi:glycoside hydrolase [Mycena maculata]|uniref:Glycoside hydrolase n=1 Tax=Mycena maculata TaxID=230809 RepID=A0AAD7HJB9_9AGAR|nr:glycoside hydrolase [Mycena maculata]
MMPRYIYEELADALRAGLSASMSPDLYRVLGRVAVLAASLVSSSQTHRVMAASVSSSPAQTFLGIGGSGAWWPYDLYHFPEPVRQNLSALLFSADGLGLSNYRWNVGSGGVNVSNPVRAIETFYVSPGVYNWTADAQGIYFLTQAAAHGVPSLTAFVNSAPAPMTSGGASCNGSFVNGTGLEYGTFLADVISHWRDEGLLIKYISPMNEPDNNFGPSPCGQEGMEVDANQRAEVITGLYTALEAKGLATAVGILADESSSLGLAEAEYSTWLPEVIDKVAALVHHTYDFPSDASYLTFTNYTKTTYPEKATWMSEICCSLGEADGTGRGWSGGFDPTITNALMFSGLVFQSFVVAGEPHYDFWTLVSNGIGCSPLDNATCATTPNPDGWTDGVIYYDADYATNGNYELCMLSSFPPFSFFDLWRRLTVVHIDLTKHFYTYKHFANFVKPGSQRHALTGAGATETMLAVSTPSTGAYVVLAMNPNATDTTLVLSFPETVCATRAVRTSAGEDFESVSPAKEEGGEWALELQAMSLTTYLFERGAC